MYISSYSNSIDNNLLIISTLLFLLAIIMVNLVEHQAYAVSGSSTDYRGECSHNQIPYTADENANQTTKAQSIQNQEFVNTYKKSFDGCLNNSNNQSKDSSNYNAALTAQNPYWIPYDIDQGRSFKNIAVILDNVDTTHNITYSEVCGQHGCDNIINTANYSDIVRVCLESEVGNITHTACHNIDTSKELQKSGQGKTGTVNSGVFVFPISMVPDNKKIRGCIEVSDIRTCGPVEVSDNGHGLVIHLDIYKAYTNYFDYYSDY